jgi:aminopeptidase N
VNIEKYAAMTVAHEVAHQWFYGIVGSDPLKEPWVDESLVDFLGFEFIRETTQETYTPLWDYVFQGLAGYKRTLRLDAPLSSFPDSTSDYFFVIYAYGSHVMRELYETIGEDAFYDALQIYIGEHGYKNAKGSDLIAAFSDAAGKDLSGWFEKRIAVH